MYNLCGGPYRTIPSGFFTEVQEHNDSLAEWKVIRLDCPCEV